MFETAYLCFLMSCIPPFWYPSLSLGESLHNRLIRLWAPLVMCLGKSTMSIPFNIILYVFIGSGAEKGGLKQKYFI